MKRLLGRIALAAVAGFIGLWLQLPQRSMLLLQATDLGQAPHTAPCLAPCGDVTLTVMTLNVLCSFCDREGYDPWAARAPELRARIRHHAPDVLGLQELSSLSDAGQVLPTGQYQISAPRLRSGAYTDALLAYKTDRFALVDEGAWWLSPTPSLPLSWGWSPAAFPRVLAWVLLRDKDSGQAILVTTAHIDNNRTNKEQAATLLGSLLPFTALTGPLVFTGDFNTHLREERFAVIQGDRQEISALALDSEQLGRLEGVPHTRRELKPDRRIDHILVSSPGTVVVERWVHDASVYGNPPRRPSDHPAIVATMTFSGSAP